MKKLYELLDRDPVRGDFGIEIEVEGDNLPTDKINGWGIHHDNSLRNGLEYVTNGAVSSKDAYDHLKTLANAFNGSSLEFSHRTSVHVHVNVLTLTSDEILSMIYTSYLVEDVLMALSGKSRLSNRFCLRVQDAEAIIGIVGHLFSTGIRKDSLQIYLSPESLKYSAVNIVPLRSYGTIEYRSMEGNMDIDRLHHWLSVLSSIREFSKGKTPTAVHDLFVKEGSDKFIKAVFGDLVDNVQGVSSLLRNYSVTYELPFKYAEAEKYAAENKEQPKPKQVKIGEMDFRFRMPHQFPAQDINL